MPEKVTPVNGFKVDKYLGLGTKLPDWIIHLSVD
jgi:hypothetical protein